MPPPRRHRPPRETPGYVLLIALLVVAAATLLVVAIVALGGSEDEAVALQAHRERALAIAEVGLERTEAWLARIAEAEVDFDEALDPGANDFCQIGPPFSAADPTGDDHLPSFTDGEAVVLPGWPAGGTGRFLRVPWPAPPAAPQGAYLVRIDDNDDDRGLGLEAATSNNALTGCLEGERLGEAWSDPVRDRDRAVVVTVVGIAPGIDPAAARARSVLRLLVGKREMSGIVAGGEVRIAGSALLCGQGASLSASGPVHVSGMCASCGERCLPSGVVARTSDGTCRRSAGPCLAGAEPPEIPEVDPLGRRWLPASCGGGLCTPIHFLRRTGSRTELWMWRWDSCPAPKEQPATCIPGGTCRGSCWVDVSAATVLADGEVALLDGDPGLLTELPAPTRAFRTPANIVFRHKGYGSAACGVAGDTFSYAPEPVPRWALPPRLPRGIWIINGSLELDAPQSMPACSSLLAGWPGASVLVRGNLVVHNRAYGWFPPPPLETALVVGGDLDFGTGDGSFSSCGGAAVLVHEQFAAHGRATLEAPLLVENGGTCFAQVRGRAVDLGGEAAVIVETTPVFSLSPLTHFSWSESSL